MNENNSSTSTDERTRSEKRAWQPPAMEELDVATATTFGAGTYNPADVTTSSS